MKSIEVLAHFNKGKIQILSIIYNKEVYKVSEIKKLSVSGFKNKKLKYYKLTTKQFIFIVSFNPASLNWNMISKN